MKRIVSAALVAVVVLGIAGCSRPATNPAAGGSNPATAPAGSLTTTAPTAPITSKMWKAMPLGAQEKARLAALPESISLYMANEKKAGRVPLKLTGAKPRFVGYQLQIWAKQPDGKFRYEYIDSIGGRLVSIGIRAMPLMKDNIGMVEDKKDRFSTGVTPKSEGEKEAVSKAAAWANREMPDFRWKAEIVAYDFYIATGGARDALLCVSPLGAGYRLATVVPGD